MPSGLAHRWFATAAVLVVLADTPATLLARGTDEVSLRVVYTASLNGNLDGCASGSAPRSGLVKRAAYLRAHGRADDILVDTGDIFDVTPDPLLSGHIVETYRELGYAAVAVGDQELSVGVDELLDLRSVGLFVSNNLSLRSQDGSETAFSDGPLVVERGPATVGLFALIDPDVFVLYPKALKDRLTLRDPGETARRLVAELRSSGVTCLIMLYHGRVESALELASEVSGMDLVVVGHEQRLVAPRRVDSTIIVSPGEEGNRLGPLDLRLDAGGGLRLYGAETIELSFLSDPDDPQVRERINSYRKELRQKIKAQP